MTKNERNARRRVAYHLRRAMQLAARFPMRWGLDDCSMFHANVELRATGRDIAVGYRNRYTTETGAKRVMGRGGLARTAAAIARRFGFESIPPEKACVGDLGIFLGVFRGKPGVSLVRCIHKGEWVGRNEHGWSIVSTKDVRKAWRYTAP